MAVAMKGLSGTELSAAHASKARLITFSLPLTGSIEMQVWFILISEQLDEPWSHKILEINEVLM